MRSFKQDRDKTRDTDWSKAVAYVRMSTEHQQYSTENQLDAISRYAAQRNITIIRVYKDAGKSGLSLSGRDALQQLLSDVESGQADFGTILVYDISRWGRFQDADESAYYEYICKRNLIQVHYCAEAFTNDGSPVATIIKSVKRMAAGEYSRDLSIKVFAGQCRLFELGFRQGGIAGFGLRRMLQDQVGIHKAILHPGEHKSIQADRVILVPGPADEVQIVQNIYFLFTVEHKTEQEIAAKLNRDGIKTDLGRGWTRSTVRQVLTNPKYQGANVYNRISFKLKQKRVRNPPNMWIRRENAFASLVDAETFSRAQAIIEERSRHLTDEELLERLRSLLQARGMLSGIIIDETADMPSASMYRSRFGSLIRAYTLIGYDPERDLAYIEINKRLREKHRNVVADLVAQLSDSGVPVAEQPSGTLLVNHEFTAGVIISRSKMTPGGSFRWTFHLDLPVLPDLTIAVRMDHENEAPLDYYLLPAIDMRLDQFRLREDNGITMDVYRFQDLTYFFRLVRRNKLSEAA